MTDEQFEPDDFEVPDDLSELDGLPEAFAEDDLSDAGLEQTELVDPMPEPINLDDIDVELLLNERAEFLEAYRRVQAEFENYRKQAQKRQSDEVLRSLGAVVERLLPVLDAGESALAHGVEGAREVYEALLAALEKEGLQAVSPLGEPFDPNVAEAVMHEPGDGGEQVVAEVFRTGYVWNDRVLRPAMVKVKD